MRSIKFNNGEKNEQSNKRTSYNFGMDMMIHLPCQLGQICNHLGAWDALLGVSESALGESIEGISECSWQHPMVLRIRWDTSRKRREHANTRVYHRPLLWFHWYVTMLPWSSLPPCLPYHDGPYPLKALAQINQRESKPLPLRCLIATTRKVIIQRIPEI